MLLASGVHGSRASSILGSMAVLFSFQPSRSSVWQSDQHPRCADHCVPTGAICRGTEQHGQKWQGCEDTNLCRMGEGANEYAVGRILGLS